MSSDRELKFLFNWLLMLINILVKFEDGFKCRKSWSWAC